MSEQPEGQPPIAPIAAPLPAAYPPGAPLPDVYPPPPEYYQQRAQAAPVFVTPGDPPGYERRPLRDAPERRRRRFLRPRALNQPISEFDVALLFLSAAVSFAVYAIILGWQVALGLTVLLFVHEMGHFVVIRRKGLPARLPIFIPLVGAFVLMGQAPLDARDEAEIALAGPFAGGLGSVACLVIAVVTRAPVFETIAFINLAINLFNLLPIGPLDGAHAARVISKKILLPALIVVAVASLCTLDALLALLAGVAIYQVVKRPSDAVLVRFYVSRKERAYVTLLYFGLLAGLLVATFGVFISLAWLPLFSSGVL